MGIFSLFVLGMCFLIMLGEMVLVLWIERIYLLEVCRKLVEVEVVYVLKSRIFR